VRRFLAKIKRLLFEDSKQKAAQIFPELNFMPIALQKTGTQLLLISGGESVFKKRPGCILLRLKKG